MKSHLPSIKCIKEALTRKKIFTSRNDLNANYENGDKLNPSLAKVLNTFDLTALGVGSTLGVGVYVLAGAVAKDLAGPAVVVSFFIAAVASILAGLCYAEFGARVPKAGSAYVYSYVCIGEFLAFIIGWNLILEYLIGSATTTKALFVYIDEVSNNTISSAINEKLKLKELNNPDVVSLILSLTFSAILAFGVKQSSLVNNIFTTINICVVLTVIIAGCWKVNPANWKLEKSQVHGHGEGGFIPYGIRGIIKGASKCFFGFIGFDCIATAGEEAKTPQKSIPLSVVMSLVIVFLAYFGISTVLTMMLPYFMQNSLAPLSYVFKYYDMTALEYAVSVGAICGLVASLFGALFPLPRVIFAMAQDGLLFKVLSKVHPTFRTPLIATLVAGILTGILACFIHLDKLIDLLSIGTLFAYTMVAVSIIILRFSAPSDRNQQPEEEPVNLKHFLRQMVNRNTKEPNRLTSCTVSYLLSSYVIICFIFGGLLTLFEDELFKGSKWIIITALAIFTLLMNLLLMISFQPVSKETILFSVPLQPWIPGLSILINTYLMTNIKTDTWVKFSYWMLLGLVIYFTYGVWHSDERMLMKERKKLEQSNHQPSSSLDT